MINIQLHDDCPATDTIVPNQFIDRFMPSANGEFVKVYLYLLRCIHSHASNCTISEIADKFNNTEMDIQRALRYWQKEGLLSLEETADGKLCGIGLLPFPEDSTDTKEASSSPAPSAVSPEETPASAAEETFCASQPVNLPQEPQIRHYTLDEIAEFQKNPDIQEMLFVVETYIRHPFSENDINTILFWHEDLHFSAELIVYLVEYCVSKGHTNLRYLNKVALAWHEKKITSVEQAKSEAAVRSKAHYAVTVADRHPHDHGGNAPCAGNAGRYRLSFSGMLGRRHLRRLPALPGGGPVGSSAPAAQKDAENQAADAFPRPEYAGVSSLCGRYRGVFRAEVGGQRHRRDPYFRRAQRYPQSGNLDQGGAEGKGRACAGRGFLYHQPGAQHRLFRELREAD